MSPQLWLLYLAAAIGLSLTPGPNGLLCLSHGARFGFGPTIATVLGGALGFLILIAASLAGAGALLAASDQAFTIAKWTGAAYLAYLGLRLWQAPSPILHAYHPAHLPDVQADRQTAPPWRLFAQGLLVAVSNPKALIFFAAFLPQFMVPGTAYATNLAILGGTFVITETIYELALARLAQRVAPTLARHGRRFNRLTGTLFIALGAILGTTQR